MIRGLLLAAGMFLVPAVWSESLPEPMGPVNDFVGVVAEEDRKALDELGVNVWKATYAEIAVAVVRRPGPWGMGAFAKELMRHWHLGNKILDNGVLILISTDEKSIHIEVGRDLAVILPPRVLEPIVERRMRPSVHAGQYSTAARSGMEAIAGALYAAAEKPPAKPVAARRVVATGITFYEGALFFLIAVLMVLFVFLCLTWISPDMRVLGESLAGVIVGVAFHAYTRRGGFGSRSGLGGWGR